MENVTEELVRQNGNQAAAVMADYAGQSGGGGAITLPIDPDSGAAMFTSLPEAGKIYNIPFPGKGLLVPVYIEDIESTGGEAPVPVVGSCYSCMYLGTSFNRTIAWDGAGVTNAPTLDISEAEGGGEGFLVVISQREGRGFPRGH